jgi:hypothetical protein
VNRREFLASAVLVPRIAQSLTTEGWRLFEIGTHVHVQNARGITRAWLPTPLVGMPYQQTLGDTYHAEGGTSVMVESEDVDMLFTEWPAGADPILTMTSRVATRDHAVDLATPRVPPPPDLSKFARYLHATRTMPSDGALKAAADQMTRGAGTDIEKARAIFDGLLREKGADSTASAAHEHFVALARVAGVPTRPVYGLRLGSAASSKAQLCRAETYLVGFGWVPVDLSEGLFGRWTAPWVAFNVAHDVTLPRSTGRSLPSFMYPQAETASGRADSQSPDTFRYEITVREGT